MCIDPVTLAIMATVAAAASSGVAMISGVRQANYQAAVARENARLSDMAAVDAIQRGRIENLTHGRRLGQMKGAQLAAMSASAIDTTTGSAAFVQGDTAMMGAEDRWMISENAMREARGYDISAANYRADALAAKSSIGGIVAGGLFDMAGTILGGATQVSSMKQARARPGAAPSFNVTPLSRMGEYAPRLRISG